ncbi:arsenate reductase/protein-tyrosine-phosphatase family protein [Chitinasiproducens palmae]|uniref:protein-tyrosine-phosphatase n=1 Tax=Chitinasiproducens palmae TaxID=1770053 RepID=A0A1H2PPB2_9BURK|nr:phosphotyrosine protein phosphatase [Chitinasiproducens palmae]SDV48599.1 protein-tyrosine phosphatase [Chitinasiproducens palmae]
MFKNVLMVCVGNICRSPTAEYLLRHRFPDKSLTVTSAGLGALVGRGVDETAHTLMHEHGIDASAHRARQIDADMIREADLILTMEKRHLASVNELVPSARGKTFLLGKWEDEREIPDPYRQQRPAFDHVYELIENSVSHWAKYL